MVTGFAPDPKISKCIDRLRGKIFVDSVPFSMFQLDAMPDTDIVVKLTDEFKYPSASCTLNFEQGKHTPDQIKSELVIATQHVAQLKAGLRRAVRPELEKLQLEPSMESVNQFLETFSEIMIGDEAIVRFTDVLKRLVKCGHSLETVFDGIPIECRLSSTLDKSAGKRRFQLYHPGSGGKSIPTPHGYQLPANLKMISPAAKAAYRCLRDKNNGAPEPL